MRQHRGLLQLESQFGPRPIHLLVRRTSSHLLVRRRLRPTMLLKMTLSSWTQIVCVHMYLYVYVYMYVYVYVYVYEYLYVHMYVHVYVHVHACVRVCACVRCDLSGHLG